MKDITIVVAGPVAVGKSTVAQIIHEALKSKGIQSFIDDDDEKIDPVVNAKRIPAVAAKSQVKIKTVQLARSGKLL